MIQPQRTSDVISTDPEIQGGVPCFAGTRVPVKSLFDALKRGRSIEYFVEQFPSVTREQASSVLELAGLTAIAPRTIRRVP